MKYIPNLRLKNHVIDSPSQVALLITLNFEQFTPFGNYGLVFMGEKIKKMIVK